SLGHSNPRRRPAGPACAAPRLAPPDGLRDCGWWALAVPARRRARPRRRARGRAADACGARRSGTPPFRLRPRFASEIDTAGTIHTDIPLGNDTAVQIAHQAEAVARDFETRRMRASHRGREQPHASNETA